MKKIFLYAALMIGATTLSFAGTPKGEAKDANTNCSAEASVKSESKTTSVMYWYSVTYDATHPNGVVLNASSHYQDGEQSEIDSPCPDGSEKDCLRGFNSALTSFPNNAAGDAQIKTDEPE